MDSQKSYYNKKTTQLTIPHSSAGNSLGICVRCGGRSSRVSGSSAARTAAGTSDFKLSKPVKGMAPGAMAPVALEPLEGLEGRLTWQGFTEIFLGGWWVFFEVDDGDDLGVKLMELDDGHFMAGLGLGFLGSECPDFGAVEYTNPS